MYDPNRLPHLKDLPSLMMEAGKNIEGYGKLVLPKLTDIEDLKPDAGCVAQWVSPFCCSYGELNNCVCSEQ